MINNIYQILVKYFSIVFCIQLIYMLVLSFKLFRPPESSNNSQESAPTSNSRYNSIMTIICATAFFAISLLAILKWKLYFILLIYFVFYISRLVYFAVSSVTTVSSIIRDPSSKKLTITEKNAITTLACLFFASVPSKWLETTVAWASSLFSSYLLDLFLCLIYAVVFFIIFFVSVSFLQTPLSLLSTGYIHIVTHISTGFKKKYLRAIQNKENQPVRKNFWCVSFIVFAKRQQKFWGLLMYLCVPLVVVADFLVTLLAFFWGMPRDILVYILRILRQLAKILHRLCERITKWSDRQVVSLSFRVATVASITSIVIINRIDSFFVHTEQSTAILEFIASAVIIPIIYSWINAWLAEKKASKSADK